MPSVVSLGVIQVILAFQSLRQRKQSVDVRRDIGNSLGTIIQMIGWHTFQCTNIRQEGCVDMQVGMQWLQQQGRHIFKDGSTSAKPIDPDHLL